MSTLLRRHIILSVQSKCTSLRNPHVQSNNYEEFLLQQLLYEKGQTFTSSAEQEIVRDIKEKHCYVSADFEGELQRAESSANMEEFYTLPDGRSVSLSTERFR